MTLNKVKNLLASQLGIKEEKINAESRISEDLGADSLDVVELLMTLEDEFGIVVSDEDAAKIKTVKDVINIIDTNSK